MGVFTQVTVEELTEFLAGYNLGTLHNFKGIAEGVQNSNFLIQTDKGQYILTLYEKLVEAQDLPFFLGLMEHLAQNGINCPLPIKNKKGVALNRLAGRDAVIVSFLEGLSISKITPGFCRQIGKGLAQLHKAGEGFSLSRKNGMLFEGWDDLFADSKGKIDPIADGLESLITEELAFLKSNWPKNLPEGIIHADLFPDNVFFLDNQLSGLIDFYFACNDMLAYDLMICLNAWCFETDGSFNVTKGRALLKGYQSVRRLTAQELESLPVLARGAAIRFLLTRIYDLLHTPEDAMVTTKDPKEYIRKLRFHQSVSNTEEYGLGI